MPTCPRCAALALVLLALAGCDSNNPGRDLSLIQGVYSLETLVFDPETQDLSAADIGARLNLAETRLEIFGDDTESLFIARYLDATGARRVNLRTTASRGQAKFDAVDVEDAEDLEALFLPRSFTLTYDGDAPRVLSATLENVSVDLEDFDPSRYQGQRGNRGTLTVSFRRP